MKSPLLLVIAGLWIPIASHVAIAGDTKPFECPELFRKLEVIQLELDSDFEKISRDRDANSQEGQNSGAQKVFTDAVLSEIGAKDPRTFRAQVRARGNSSVSQGESSFPKLRVKIDPSESLHGTSFENARGFRVNTHVSIRSKDAYTPMGRLAGENGPWREGLAYALAEPLGLLTPGRRQARILYRDVKTGETFERNALLIETESSLVKRHGMELVDYEKFASDEASGIDPVEGARFYLYHHMIGNADFQLRVNERATNSTELYRPAWNTPILDFAGKRRPVVYDLDMSGVVREISTAEIDPAFGIKAGPDAAFVKSASALFAHFTKDQLRTAADAFKSRREALYEIVGTYRVDEDGRKLAKQHLDVFFANLDNWLDLSVVAGPGVRFFQDAAGAVDKLPAGAMTGMPGTLRMGTPVKVLGTEGGYLKVAIIDAFRDLPSSEPAIGYIPKSSPIASSLTPEQVRTVDLREILPGG